MLEVCRSVSEHWIIMNLTRELRTKIKAQGTSTEAVLGNIAAKRAINGENRIQEVAAELAKECIDHIMHCVNSDNGKSELGSSSLFIRDLLS